MSRLSTSLLAATAVLALGIGQAAHAETIRVAFVPQIQGIPYYVAMENGANAAAAEFDVDYVQQGPTSTNAVDQLRIFESFVNQGFDVVGGCPEPC